MMPSSSAVNKPASGHHTNPTFPISLVASITGTISCTNPTLPYQNMGINDKYREAEQNQKAYQKQAAIFVARKRVVGAKKQKSMRYVRNVGLGFKTPKEAIEGNYVDKKCPFTGNVSIRGRILKGLVISAGKMTNTVVVRRDYLHYISKYRRYEKRHKNVHVHCSPAFPTIKEGDVATIGQCRPLAKTVRFNVLAVEPTTNSALNIKKVFRMF